MNIILVGLGGFIGAIARYQIGNLAQSFSSSGFPIGTFSVNVLGSFLIGLAWYAFQSAEVFSETGKMLLIVGFIGSFTTFSAFSNDTLILFQSGQLALAFVNILGQVVLCLLATFAGLKIGECLF